ncbi:MAG: SsrA-binding protein SmpB [Patescibacteria group bacterium]
MQTLNKRARFEYALEPERYEAGISLSGGEAKAVRTGHADISQAVARILNGEAFLINANIPVQGARKYDSKRTRKLLLHKDEIVSISTKTKQKKLTLVPTKMYTKGRLVKVELALGRAKRKFEKRQALKKKDIEREIAREFRGR